MKSPAERPGQVMVSGLRSTYHPGLIRSGVVNQNGRPENLACRLAAPKIVSPVIAPNIAAGDVTPIRTNAIRIGFHAKRSTISAATPTIRTQDRKPTAGR